MLSMSCLTEQAPYDASTRQAVVSAVMHNEWSTLLEPLWPLRKLKSHCSDAALLHVVFWDAHTAPLLQYKNKLSVVLW